MPSHYLNQCWYIVDRNIKFQWNLKQNLYIFIQENAFENVVCEMAAIFSQLQCVNLFMATIRGVWIIPSFRIWDYVLYVEHISCVTTNCGQHQWAVPSLFWIAVEVLLEEIITRKLLSLFLDFFFKILLLQVTFLIFFFIAVFCPYFLLVGLLLQYVALFQAR